MALAPGLALAEVAGSVFCPLPLHGDFYRLLHRYSTPPLKVTIGPARWHGVGSVDRSQPEGVSSKTTAAATSADDQSWSAAPWH